MASPTERGAFERWSGQGHDATRRGEFRVALDAYLRARAAVDPRDVSRRDAADINVAMARIQIGDLRRGEEGLREILLRTDDARTAFTASYNLASSLRRQGRHDKAMAYARRAFDRARTLGESDLLALAHGLTGNIHLARSLLDLALEEYRAALALRVSETGDTRYSRAILLENIGYCLLLRRDLDAGLEQIRVAREIADEVGDRRCVAECLQDECYAHLVAGRHDAAIAAGIAALELARENGYDDIEENCHYMLGEIGSKTGDLERRDEHFDRLQERHPELPFLKDFLCAVDVTDIITLKR